MAGYQTTVQFQDRFFPLNHVTQTPHNSHIYTSHLIQTLYWDRSKNIHCLFFVGPDKLKLKKERRILNFTQFWSLPLTSSNTRIFFHYQMLYHMESTVMLIKLIILVFFSNSTRKFSLQVTLIGFRRFGLLHRSTFGTRLNFPQILPSSNIDY